MKTPSTAGNRPAIPYDDLAPFVIRSYDKQELATLYAPSATTTHALRKFNSYIRRNRTLHAELVKTGFTITTRQFTPFQVRLIIDLLGEP